MMGKNCLLYVVIIFVVALAFLFDPAFASQNCAKISKKSKCVKAKGCTYKSKKCVQLVSEPTEPVTENENESSTPMDKCKPARNSKLCKKKKQCVWNKKEKKCSSRTTNVNEDTEEPNLNLVDVTQPTIENLMAMFPNKYRNSDTVPLCGQGTTWEWDNSKRKGLCNGTTRENVPRQCKPPTSSSTSWPANYNGWTTWSFGSFRNGLRNGLELMQLRDVVVPGTNTSFFTACKDSTWGANPSVHAISQIRERMRLYEPNLGLTGSRKLGNILFLDENLRPTSHASQMFLHRYFPPEDALRPDLPIPKLPQFIGMIMMTCEATFRDGKDYIGWWDKHVRWHAVKSNDNGVLTEKTHTFTMQTEDIIRKYDEYAAWREDIDKSFFDTFLRGGEALIKENGKSVLIYLTHNGRYSDRRGTEAYDRDQAVIDDPNASDRDKRDAMLEISAMNRFKDCKPRARDGKPCPGDEDLDKY